MSVILFIAVIVAIALAVLVKLAQKQGSTPTSTVLSKLLQIQMPTATDFPYQRTGALFSPAERSFLGVLHQAVGNNAAIFGKVRVADVVEPETGLSRSDRQSAFNRISGKHFDFLLCDNENLSVICAIELDDRSHQSKNRHQRDEFLQGVCEAAGVPLIQVPAKSGYVIEDVKQMIAPHFTTIGTTHQESSPARQELEINEKVCPKCSASMVKRVAKKGTHAGEEFWACSAFPKCRTIKAIGA
jgi:ssDNA-binding Zn-finger/Zn-ribbon topoisomerase 1